MKSCDVAIIGGGASGLAAALAVSEANGALKTAVLEAGARVGRKLIATGNGRCNISNRDISEGHYRSRDLDKAMSVLDGFSVGETERLFSSLGVPLRELDGGRLYPYSLQAGTVVDVLRLECERRGVEILPNERVKSVTRGAAAAENAAAHKSDAAGNSDAARNGDAAGNGGAAGEIIIATESGSYFAKSVIVACGGKAAPSLGGSSDGYRLLEALGHSCTPLTPEIVPVKTELEKIRPLKGVKADCTVTFSNKNGTRSETGEVLFTEYGLSGPPVLQLSSILSGAGEAEATLDLLPEYSRSEVFAYIMARRGKVYGDRAENLFLGLLNKRVGLAVVKYCGVGVNDPCSRLDKKQIAALADAVKGFKLKITAACGFDAAQVTRGGVPMREFDADLMSKKCAGVFACGEVLDVTGDCGGFNLQWAWASGTAAGRAAARYAEDKL